MRPVVGQTPRGDDFFRRPEIVNKIYRRLRTSHVYLAAPRRVGKTAIMRFLEDNPMDKYEFKYIITQAVMTGEDYYKYLLEQTDSFKNLSQASRDMIRDFLRVFKKVGAAGMTLELQDRSSTYFEECRRTFKQINTDGKTLVLMIDEFSQTVDNISKKEGAAEAERFLYGNRTLQEEANDNIRFIYTGSIGLESLCSRLRAPDALNKLNTIEVGPLSYEEGVELCAALLDYEKVSYTEEVIGAILDGVKCLIPFHIQLLIQQLVDVHLETGKPLNAKMVDESLERITDRKSKHYFEHYHNHIKKGYEGDGNKYQLIMAILRSVCEKDHVSRSEFEALAEKFNETEGLNSIIEMLEYDGYIYGNYSVSPAEYRFTSPIIRRWWKRNML